MCGFILSIGSVKKEEIISAVNKIKYRGPDETNFYFDESYDLSMGHNRLSILDDKYGVQPYFSKDKSLILLFNGEIYNFKELRIDLEEKGVKFESKNSDTEVLLNGYKYYEKDFFPKIDGPFACAIVDKKKNRIILGRDKFGEKPLFFTIQKNTLIVSSELKVFSSFKNLKTTIDLKSLQKYFIFSFVPSPQTLYKNIFKVENSYLYEFNKDNLSYKKIKYYEIGNKYSKKTISNYKNSIEILDNLFEKSVKSRLISDHKVGIFLSGGIDSSLVAYYAKKLSNNITSYTLSVEGKSFDESKKAKKLAKYLNLNNKDKIFDLNYFNQNFENILNKLDEPIGASTFVPMYVVSELASKECKSVICGDGGDEIFGGYEIFKYVDIIKNLGFLFNKNTYQATKSLMNLLPISKNNLSLDFKIRRFLQGMNYKTQFKNTMFLSPISIEDLKEIFNEKIEIEDLFSHLISFENDYKFNSVYDRTVLYFVNYYLPDLVCSRADKAGMLNSLEIRTPFLNSEILEFALSLPNNFKSNLFQTKIILRDLLKTKINKKYVDKSKIGFTFPMQAWMNIDKDYSFSNINNKYIENLKLMHLKKKYEFRNLFYNLEVLKRFNS